MIEPELIKLIQNSIIPDAVKLEEHHEADIYSQQMDLYAELKCVKSWYPRLLIEKKKYDELMALTDAKRIRYICSTDRGVYSFNLRRIVIPDDWWKRYKISNHSTYFHREIDGPSYKLGAKLPIGWAKNITELIGWEKGM